ncbi:MAG TPA: YggT family protein, partial [Nevskia sp.]|nr:YggT family protein [Nevskia sp.]
MNAVVFLIPAIFNILLAVLILRVLLQLARANFYNPISQLIWRATQPVVGPLARFIPRWRTLDLAGLLVLLLAACFYVWFLNAVLPEVFIAASPSTGLKLALLIIVNLTAKLYALSIFAQALLSWVGPGVNNPNANVLFSLNEPLLRPVRRILPPVSGLDLSPIPVMLILLTIVHVLA